MLNRSERVKCVDLHPSLPWVAVSLYAGTVTIYDYEQQAQVRTLEITNSPVRCARFIARKQWIIIGSDDNKLRIFNCNTAEKLKTIDEHTDYIRHIVVHPTLPYTLSCSDDDSIRLFDWDQQWKMINTYADHDHYIMQLAINPKDPSMFASASLDKKIKIWSINLGQKTTANYTLVGHEAGVNCVDFSHAADKPQLVSGDDDCVVKVWDYQTRQCLYTLEGSTNGGHSESVSSVKFHPDLPLIISGGEDDLINIWDSQSYKQITQLQYGLKRVWTISAVPDCNYVAFGFDEGTIVIKIGKDLPLATYSNGKVVWIRQREVQTFNLKLIQGADESSKDGEKINPQNCKELGQSEFSATNLKFSPSGRFVAVLGDSDYVIYAYPKYTNAAFGSGSELVWATVNPQSHMYATRLDNGTVEVYQNFQRLKSFKTVFANEGIFGGRLLSIKSSEFITFYDWETFQVIRRIDIGQEVKHVHWSDDGLSVVLAMEDSFYLLKYNADFVADAIQNDQYTEDDAEDGLEDAFEFQEQFQEVPLSSYWVSNECFVFINLRGNINYLIGGRVLKSGSADKKQFILGYDSKQSRLYLVDKALNIYAHRLLMSVILFQAAIMKGDMDKAEQLRLDIPESQNGKLSKFLEMHKHLQMAFEMTPDADHKFELALQLRNIQAAFEIATQQDSQEKYKQVGDIALQKGQFTLAEQCYNKANDFNSLLLFYSSYGDQEGLKKLVESSESQGKYNVAFEAAFLLADVDASLRVLIKAKRFGEAAAYAQNYCPSRLEGVTRMWSDFLEQQQLMFKPNAIEVSQTDLELECKFRDLWNTERPPASQIQKVAVGYFD